MKYLYHEDFPLSNKYDPMWVFENEMGPNVLWLTEFVCQKMDLKPGMRVLDMGCGKAISSIFLAKEFGVKVVANDLWIDPTENWKRIKAHGLDNEIVPIKAEANELLYAEGYFDAAICVDSYAYYGQSPEYTRYFTKFIRAEGEFGLCQICLRRKYSEVDLSCLPGYLVKRYKGDVDKVHEAGEIDPSSLIHTLEEWKESIEKSGRVVIRTADLIKNGCQNHVRFLEEHRKAGFTYRAPEELEEWKTDGGKNIGFLRIVAQVK